MRKSKDKERKMKEENEAVRRRFQQLKVSGEDRHMLKVRQSLPAWKEQDKIINTIRDNQVVITIVYHRLFFNCCGCFKVVVVSGMTGCGKVLL